MAPVCLYQRFISPALSVSCRYYPTRSVYAITALKVHDLIKGLPLALWCLLRCNPLARGGVDHVPDKGQWRYRHPRDTSRSTVEDPWPKPLNRRTRRRLKP